MPGKLFFGVKLHRSSIPPIDQRDAAQLPGKTSPVPAVSEIRLPNMDHIRSLSRKDRSSSNSKDKQAKHKKVASAQVRPIKLDMIIESPPVVMYDNPSDSSGALVSGRLQLTPQLPNAVLNTIAMYLECTTATKRPVQDRCRECHVQVKDLEEWTFLSHPKTFALDQGMQELPFSCLIPGHLPATAHGHIGSIDYSLHVRAKSADGQEMEFRRELHVKRALRPGNDKNSMRVFPPTDFTVHVTLPNIIHPIGEFPVTFRMQGMTATHGDKQDRWRLRKLNWRVEEVETTISPACAAHAAKVGGPGKGIEHRHTRDIGAEELKSGWKTDLSDGQIDGEFMAHIDHTTRPQTEVDAGHGLKIAHNLVLELVIAEEWAPTRKPMQATPTGAARVLRTNFTLHLTERSGLGIAWDDEQPPMYEDVPASPPHYLKEGAEVVEYTGDIEELSLGN